MNSKFLTTVLFCLFSLFVIAGCGGGNGGIGGGIGSSSDPSVAIKIVTLSNKVSIDASPYYKLKTSTSTSWGSNTTFTDVGTSQVLATVNLPPNTPIDLQGELEKNAYLSDLFKDRQIDVYVADTRVGTKALVDNGQKGKNIRIKVNGKGEYIGETDDDPNLSSSSSSSSSSSNSSSNGDQELTLTYTPKPGITLSEAYLKHSFLGTIAEDKMTVSGNVATLKIKTTSGKGYLFDIQITDSSSSGRRDVVKDNNDIEGTLSMVSSKRTGFSVNINSVTGGQFYIYVTSDGVINDKDIATASSSSSSSAANSSSTTTEKEITIRYQDGTLSNPSLGNNFGGVGTWSNQSMTVTSISGTDTAEYTVKVKVPSQYMINIRPRSGANDYAADTTGVHGRTVIQVKDGSKYAITSLVDNDQKNGKNLKFYIDAGGVITDNQVDNGNNNNVAPTKPLNLTGTITNGRDVSLKWEAASGTITGYRVYKNGNREYETSDLTYKVQNLVNGDYTFSIRAYNNYNGTIMESGDSNVYIITINAVSSMMPTSLSGTQTGNSMVLTWTAVSGATEYEIFRNGVSISKVNGTGYTDSGLNLDNTYSWYVMAKSATSTSGSSNVYQWKMTAQSYPIIFRATIPNNTVIFSNPELQGDSLNGNNWHQFSFMTAENGFATKDTTVYLAPGTYNVNVKVNAEPKPDGKWLDALNGTLFVKGSSSEITLTAGIPGSGTGKNYRFTVATNGAVSP